MSSRPHPPDAVLGSLTALPARRDRVTHTEHLPARRARHAEWPEGIRPEVTHALRALGVDRPWTHQARVTETALRGRSVVVATGTASGKSLGYLVPVVDALLDGAEAANGRGATVLYLAPTKALAADQLRAADRLLAQIRDAERASGPPGASGVGRTPGTGGAEGAAGEGPAGAAGEGPAGAAGERSGAGQAPRTGRGRRPAGGPRAALYDGDTPPVEREWVRQSAAYVLTNPDMLHQSILPGHQRWAGFLRALRYVVVDECHTYRGVFGSHVAQVLRRLRRLCRRYGSDPVFVLASATASDPGASASRLTGLPVEEVLDDGSPRGELVFALWEPPMTELSGEHGAPVRRTATAETAEILTDLVVQGVRTVAFVRSRRAAELVSLVARERLTDAVGPSLARRVGAYRGGYLADERRAIERALHSGRLLGLSSTTALELGLDVTGLDAVLLAGYPGTRASVWQQAGRAGRAGQGALAVLVARDDPLDTYLVHHPDALFGRPVETTVLDPDNPHVLAPHLCAAAAELPLTEADAELFGPSTGPLLEQLERRRLLRRRASGWFWTRRERPAGLVDIRGGGGTPVRIVEASSGRVLGTVDAAASHTAVHDGAVHLHQGRTYLVRELDLEESVALVEEAEPPYTTVARDTTSVSVLDTDREVPLAPGVTLSFGSVEVTNQVVSYLRRRLITGEVLGEKPLDLPPRTLRTRAVWWTLTDDRLEEAGVLPEELPGALHAAEHAAIGLLPLFATCDRWDIGGVSVPLHPDTGAATVFVYDGHPGGAGFAERGFRAARDWIAATRDAIASCECEHGCPSCVQSPKCGNGNDPLDKAAAIRTLDAVLGDGPPDGPPGPVPGPAPGGLPDRAAGESEADGGGEAGGGQPDGDEPGRPG